MDSSLQTVAIGPTPPQTDPFLLFGYMFFAVIVGVASIAGYWKMFVKAGRPGWDAIIPFYNVYVLIKIAKQPGWWFILYFIPLVNIAVSLIVAIKLAKAFGKSTVFGVVFNWLIHPIGALILGFGSAKYNGSTPPPAGGPTPTTPPIPSTPPTPPAPQTPAPAPTG